MVHKLKVANFALAEQYNEHITAIQEIVIWEFKRVLAWREQEQHKAAWLGEGQREMLAEQE